MTQNTINSLTTAGIKITVRSFYMEADSHPNRNLYVFAYQIEIRNESQDEIQLLARKWDICDALGVHKKVEGVGVVGEQPILQPNQSFTYVSGCHLPTQIGTMQGQYLLHSTERGKSFWVPVPCFLLIDPFLLN